jgi:leucyl-tRNA synthetase
MYLMFMGSYGLGGDWDDSGINGIARFLGRVYRLVEQNAEGMKCRHKLTYSNIKDKDVSLNYRLNLTIKRVTADLDNLDFNTAISACMELVNDLYKIADEGKRKTDLFYFALEQLILIMAPLAPHLGEELWTFAVEDLAQALNRGRSVFNEAWPTYDPAALELSKITMVVQINGKVRGSFDVSAEITEDALFVLATNDEHTAKYLGGKQVVKKIFVSGKLLNIVVR